MDGNEEGVICPRCQKNDTIYHLKFLYISLDEMVLKCENSTCLYPFENFKYKNVKDGSISTPKFEDDNNPELADSATTSVFLDLSTGQLVNGENDMKLQDSKPETNIVNTYCWENEYNWFEHIQPNPTTSNSQIQESQMEVSEEKNTRCIASNEHEKDGGQQSTTTQEQKEQKESTTATISKYLELIKAKHKKTKGKISKSSAKCRKDTKISFKIGDGDKIKSVVSKIDTSTSRPLDILRKIQRL